MPTVDDKIVDGVHDIPSAVPTIEERFRNADGTLNHIEAQKYLLAIQAKGNEASVDEIKDAIQVIRLLRRTNTGPAGAKKTKKPKVEPVLDINDLI